MPAFTAYGMTCPESQNTASIHIGLPTCSSEIFYACYPFFDPMNVMYEWWHCQFLHNFITNLVLPFFLTPLHFSVLVRSPNRHFSFPILSVNVFKTVVQISFLLYIFHNAVSSISIVTRLWTGRNRNCSSIPGRARDFICPLISLDHFWTPLKCLFRGYREPHPQV